MTYCTYKALINTYNTYIIVSIGGIIMKRRYVYPAIFHPEDTGFSVFFPDLKGCQTQGDTLEEATIKAQEALGIYMECLIDDKKKIPAASSPGDLQISGNDFVVMICIDIKDYLSNNKPVKKTLSIPAWLNEEAEKQHINFSSLLKEALIEKLSD